MNDNQNMGGTPDAPRAEAVPAKRPAQKDSWVEVVKTVVYALLIAGVIRSLLFQPFNIPSASMEGTLLVGDYLFVSKFSYGYSRHSFPFGLMPIPGRVMASPPDRGDVVVFKLPADDRTDFIKRVIGLPGDRIQVMHGVLYINGTAAARERLEPFVENIAGFENRIARYRETLPNGVTYEILDREPNSHFDNTGVFAVPEGHYFMMGDNRDDSDDSRGGVGYVPLENLVGKAQIIFFSTDGSARLWEIWKWPLAIRYERIGDRVD